MRYVRTLGVCLVAVCAISVIAATSASAALPEFGKCVKVPVEANGKLITKGKYANSNCTEKAKGGEYEWLKGTTNTSNTEFTAVQTSANAELETELGISVVCDTTVAHGLISGTKEVSDVSVTFEGCKLLLLSFTCESFFRNEYPNKYVYNEGEIQTRSLKGHLGYIEGKGTESPEVGLGLEPEEPHGLFAEFVCGTENSGVGVLITRVGAKEKKGSGDSIISPITPVNEMGTVLTQTYAEKTIENGSGEIERERGHQDPESFEGKKIDVLESETGDGFGTLGWTKSGQIETLETRLNSGEELEIKA